MKITAHCLVKNEENFVWYAINSVISYVDEVTVWDQGSIDNTKSVIQSINNKKIKFKTVPGNVAQVRERMLEETEADWILPLDGDEIWYEEGIQNFIKTAQSESYDVIAVPNYMLIGDVYHYQEEKAGKYNIAGRVGHFNIRGFKSIRGMRVEGIYPNEAYTTRDGLKLQNFSREKISFLEIPYLHASFLQRSSKDSKKFKYEIGEKFPNDFYYPEVFFKDRPLLVPSPWRGMDLKYKLNAFWQTPLKKIKRRII